MARKARVAVRTGINTGPTRIRGNIDVPPMLVSAASWSWRLLIVAAVFLGLVLLMNRLTVVVVPIFAAALLAAPNINGAGHRAWRVLSGWIVAGFLLQAAALSTGALAVVEPILIVELPLTLVLAGVVFGQHLHGREWTVTAASTLGLTGVLYFLSPTGETGSGVPALTWIIGIAVNVAVVGVLVAVARRESTSDTLAAGLLGIATGTAFGLPVGRVGLRGRSARRGQPGAGRAVRDRARLGSRAAVPLAGLDPQPGH